MSLIRVYLLTKRSFSEMSIFSLFSSWKRSLYKFGHSSPPSPPTGQSQAPLLTCGSCWTAAHGINSSSYSWQPFSHPHTQWFISQLELTVSLQEFLKELRILLFQRALYKLPSRDVFRKGNYFSFFIITISASNLYMPMLRLFVFLLDFLIPFLCDPGLQCGLIYCNLAGRSL